MSRILALLAIVCFVVVAGRSHSRYLDAQDARWTNFYITLKATSAIVKINPPPFEPGQSARGCAPGDDGNSRPLEAATSRDASQ